MTSGDSRFCSNRINGSTRSIATRPGRTLAQPETVNRAAAGRLRAATMYGMTLRIAAVLGMVTSMVASCGSDSSPAPDLLPTEQDASGAGTESSETGGGSSSLPNPAQPQGEASVASDGTKDASAADVVVARDGGAHDVAPLPSDPCIEAGTCKPGEWINVTPPSVDLAGTFGPGSVQVDSARPQDVYSQFGHHGIWKSTDYGRTWNGPINTGTNGAKITQTVGYIRIPPRSADMPLTMYLGCVESGETGFWRSTNGGVDWNGFAVNVPGSNLTFYAPAVDPYDAKHLTMAGHLVDLLVESMDGGETWKAVTIDATMKGNSVYSINFIDTGNPATTRTTWLLLSGAAPHTWRTTNSGTTWTQVLDLQHPAGESQIYQPDTSGAVFAAGLYSSRGDGVFRSSDYGATWSPVGKRQYAKLVFGTSTRVYSMYGNVACMPGGCTNNPMFQVADQPGTGTWAALATTSIPPQGPTMATVTSDGTYHIIITANYGAGLWRYVEPLR